MSFEDLQTYYKSIQKVDDFDEAIKQAEEEGHGEEEAAHERAAKIMDAIKRKNEYKDDMEVKKSTYAHPDTFAIATAKCQELGYTDFSPDSDGRKCRDWYADRIDRKTPGSKGRVADSSYAGGSPPTEITSGADQIRKAALQKLSPALAGLMSAAAGWAMSDSVVEAGGGSPRGRMSDTQAREWERTLSAAERRAEERAMRSRMRRKSADGSTDAMAQLKTFYDESDTYVRRTPVLNGVSVQKEHSMSPPRAGEVWDAVKHRWVKPENVGHSVSEVQGKKRIRGTGTGVHERSVAGHGSGKTRLVERGRRFKSTADAGSIRPHITTHAGLHRRRK